jgi:SPP1 gp7 family putative phage head morphogenesis protein
LLRPDVVSTMMNGIRREYYRLGNVYTGGVSITDEYVMKRTTLLKESADRVVRSIINDIMMGDFTKEELIERVQQTFNVSRGRAKLIAQTETTAAFNNGRLVAMKEQNREYKQWINSGDANVRPSHQINTIIPVDEYFVLSSGIRVLYPGDGPPSESCNCRCSIISVDKEQEDE